MRRNGQVITAFSALLLMTVLAFVGIVSLPMLNIQYMPSDPGHTIYVSYSYAGATPEVVEAEVTSKIEGVLSRIRGNVDVSSSSGQGNGQVSVTFTKDTDMAVARLEVASAIRNIHSELPSGVSYPSISHDVSGRHNSASISYLLKGDMPSLELDRFAREHIMPAVTAINGVDRASVSGATPFQWVITFDSSKAASAGISASDIAAAFNSCYSERIMGTINTADGVMAVRMSCHAGEDFGTIPIKNWDGRVIYLRDIAEWSYQEALPSGYYRVNGLNTVTLAVGTVPDVNILKVTDEIKNTVQELQRNFPEEISVSLAYDSSEYIRAELKKIYVRTAMCVAILLLFVALVCKSWRYMLTMVLSLAVNLLISLAVYAFVGISIHIYTLAGITVSIGIIIDTSIIMIDHYARFRDRKMFPALIAAISTTVLALVMVLLLPEAERRNLTDFIWVLSLNLSVSLFVSYLFVPALLDYLPIKDYGVSASRNKLRRQVVFRRVYERYIRWGLRHRWVYAVAFVMAFGIPLCVLPTGAEMNMKTEKNLFQKCLEKIVTWDPYEENRRVIDKVAGSSFAAFHKSLSRSNFYREPERKALYVRAGMLEGCTVHQLNEVVTSMENYLAGFDEIKVFTTQIYSSSAAVITIEFKPEFENTPFPLRLKADVTAMAINFGGANWSIYGIDENGFNNNIVSDYKSHRVTLKGYNYQKLCDYAGYLLDYLSANKRVSAPEIWGSAWSGKPRTEYNLSYDFERMFALGISPYAYYNALSSILYEGKVASVESGGEYVDVLLRSSDVESFDLWHVLNSPVSVDSSMVALTDVGSIEKRRSGLDIRKSQQSYEVSVCFDFIGSYELSRKVVDDAVNHMNSEILPVGYKADDQYGGWFMAHKERYAWLIMLIIVVIFIVLAITFESLRLPLSVIFMIPISFIGLFLTFGLSDLSFDQGGFAAFVMLSGIVVNAGIYILMTYVKMNQEGVRAYYRAFSLKIVPIMLTAISTILGLLPFLTDGPDEVFWFDFAIGTIGGMFFSIIALIFVLPVFCLKKNDK